MSYRSMRCRVVVALAAAFSALIPAAAQAMHAANTLPASKEWTPSSVSFSLEPSIGLLEGTADEYVFDYPSGRKFKLSELNWDLKNVAMAGLQAGIGFGGRFRVNIGYWSALTEGDGRMVDRDWAYRSYFDAGLIDPNNIGDGDWTHRSVHPDTTLDNGSLFDLNLSFVPLKYGPFALSIIQGYKRNQWKWSARGGTAVYTPLMDPNTADLAQFRSHLVDFTPGVRIISYEQEYSIPYIGLGATLAGASYVLESHVLLSNAVMATDRDYHDERSVLFEGDFSGGHYVGIGLSATWAFARHWTARLGVEYQVISEIVGDVTISGAEGRWFDESGGGIAMNATMYSLGAGYRF